MLTYAYWKWELPWIGYQSYKTSNLLSCGYVNNTAWMHHMDANITHKEKAWWKLQKYVEGYFKQILEAIPLQKYGCTATNFLSPKKRPSKTNLRSMEELIHNVLPWTLTHRLFITCQPARNYMHQLCADTRYSLEDLPGAMVDRNGWRERVRKTSAGCVTRW